MKIGFGWDLHKLKKGRPLILGGVTIPFPKGEDGHSDGDVLIHAIIDSIFGALNKGDIGKHFPPSDPQYKNISSRILLKKTAKILKENNYKISNIDTTIVLQKPKILPFIDSIKNNLAEDLKINKNLISVKGKTKEKVDATGKGKAIEAYASLLIDIND